MPARFGLSSLAFAVAAFLAAPALADNYPYSGVVAPFPKCPHGFSVNYATTTTFACTNFVAAKRAGSAVEVASRTGCRYSDFWNSGPQVTLRPLVGGALVRWVCRHN